MVLKPKEHPEEKRENSLKMLSWQYKNRDFLSRFLSFL